MPLKPLEQWYCDRCDEVIEKPADGWVHWRRDSDGREHTFEIFHRRPASPLGGKQGCGPERVEADMHIEHMLGPMGLARFLALVDPGSFFEPDPPVSSHVRDVRSWAETARRLHVPFYEQARRYFERARLEGEIDGINPMGLCSEDTLKRLIATYEGRHVSDDRVLTPSRKSINLSDPLELTLDNVRKMIAGGDDSKFNQIRVKKDGVAYLHESSGSEPERFDDLAFRLETFAPGNGYVGPGAAKDDEFIRRVYNVLRNNWPNPEDSYIDVW